MKFRFKIQEYQTEAVAAVTKVFKGQPYCDMVKYTRDLGIRNQQNAQQSFDDLLTSPYDVNDDGFENANIVLSDDVLLENIKQIQQANNIKVQDELVKHLGRCSLNQSSSLTNSTAGASLLLLCRA